MAARGIREFFEEARRRRVFHVAALYIVGAWVVLQAADLAFPGLGIAESAIRFVWAGAILGLPIALFFGWRYDITGGRIVRTPPAESDSATPLARCDYVILSSLTFVIVAMIAGLLLQIAGSREAGPTVAVVADVDPKSVAVLPFVAMTPVEDDEYFSDGLSEELLNSLAKIKNLKVAGRTSSFYFKGKSEDLRDIGAKLGVAHVLEGSVRRSGDRLRITAQLVQVSDGYHLWSAVYDRSAADIFDIQTDIATKVTDALRITLLEGQQEKISSYGTTNAEARSLYLVAKARLRRLNRWLVAPSHDHVRSTRHMLEEVVSIDPQYAEAWAALARALLLEPWIMVGDSSEPLGFSESSRLAGEAIDSARRLNPALPAIELAQADLEYQRHKLQQGGAESWERAANAFERAVAAAPNDAEVLEAAAAFHLASSDPARAADLYGQALLIDPLSDVRLHRAEALLAGELAEARQEYLRTAELYPESAWKLGMARLELELGHPHHALAWSAGTPRDFAVVPFLWASLGDKPAATRALEAIHDAGGNTVWHSVATFLFERDYQGFRDWLSDNDVRETLATRHAGNTCRVDFLASFYLRDWHGAAAANDACAKYRGPDVGLSAGAMAWGTTEGVHEPGQKIWVAHSIAVSAYAYDQAGRLDDAVSMWPSAIDFLASAEPNYASERRSKLHVKALLHAGMGDTESALVALEALSQNGWSNFLMGIAGLLFEHGGDYGWFEDNPMLDRIRDEPRFIAVVEEVKARNARMLEEYRAGLSLDDFIDEEILEPVW